ncbi:hypothetical protein MHU86_24373 [Fragilaria crotonensis]|nr:hypothetical protein MHU86_24373 [Fragilaria crotonensis]
MSNSITVILTLSNVPNSARVPLEVAADESPASLRAKASEATKIPLETMRLIFRGRLVGNENDKNAVEEYKLEQDSVIHCMGKPVQTAVVPSPSSATATSGSSVTVPVTTGVPVGATSASPATLTAALTALRDFQLVFGVPDSCSNVRKDSVKYCQQPLGREIPQGQTWQCCI